MLKNFLADNSMKNQLQKKVFHLIHQHGPISKHELLELTNTKQTTLNRMMDELLRPKYIQESGLGQSSGGRPPVLYEVNSRCAYIIGIDISRAETKLVLVDVSFNLLSRMSFPMTKGDVPSLVFSKIKEIISGWLTTYHISLDQLLGIGVGAVGPIQREKGIIVKPEAFLAPDWDNVHVAGMLKESFPVKIIVDNGANSAVIGEYSQHISSYKNILYVISGYGFRCGVVNNGRPIHSRQGDASAYGHIIVQAGDKVCSCGKRGCLTAYASFGAMIDEVKEEMKSTEKPSLQEIIDAINNGDSTVRKVVGKSAYYFGIGIANMINVLHPDLVVLHGLMIFESDWYYEEVVKHSLKNTYVQGQEAVKFSRGTLGVDAIAIGAAIQIFQSHFLKI